MCACVPVNIGVNDSVYMNVHERVEGIECACVLSFIPRMSVDIFECKINQHLGKSAITSLSFCHPATIMLVYY